MSQESPQGFSTPEGEAARFPLRTFVKTCIRPNVQLILSKVGYQTGEQKQVLDRSQETGESMKLIDKQSLLC